MPTVRVLDQTVCFFFLTRCNVSIEERCCRNLLTSLASPLAFCQGTPRFPLLTPAAINICLNLPNRSPIAVVPIACACQRLLEHAFFYIRIDNEVSAPKIRFHRDDGLKLLDSTIILPREIQDLRVIRGNY